MHTYKTENLTIQYNSDYSGDCVIIDNKTGVEITARCEEVTGFAANGIRDSIISRIEDMESRDILSANGKGILMSRLEEMTDKYILSAKGRIVL